MTHGQNTTGEKVDIEVDFSRGPFAPNRRFGPRNCFCEIARTRDGPCFGTITNSVALFVRDIYAEIGSMYVSRYF